MLRFLLLVSCFTAVSVHAAYEDKIFDDIKETETFSLHSRGLISYGFHSNTVHLRHFFLRASYQREEAVQFFATLNGYADTHEPTIAYTYALNNVSLYDYGFIYRFLGGFFVSPRAAAVYREDLETFMAMPAYIYGSPAEFDPVTNYLVMHKSAPGIRFGYGTDRWEVGYSQGDYRHSIPSGLMAKVKFDDFYLRAVTLAEYTNEAIFDRSSLVRKVQLSGAGKLVLTPKITLGLLGEVTYLDNGKWRLRAEQAMEHFGMTLGLRELWINGGEFVMEVSLKRRVADMVAIGAQYASNGSWYLVGNIDF